MSSVLFLKRPNSGTLTHAAFGQFPFSLYWLFSKRVVVSTTATTGVKIVIETTKERRLLRATPVPQLPPTKVYLQVLHIVILLIHRLIFYEPPFLLLISFLLVMTRLRGC